jgi:hypothetical protein
MPSVKKTPLTEREKVVLSAWFARSNMGMERAGRAATKRLLETERLDLSGATIALCGEFMESDEHEKIFEQEADGWFKDTFSKKYKTREAVLAVWPDVAIPFCWVEVSLADEVEEAIKEQPKARRRLVDTELLGRVLKALREMEKANGKA